jgi:hypothetical protein
MEPIPRTGGLGREGKPDFWITDQRKPTTSNVHIAFEAADRATVDAFHAAAVAAGGKDNGGRASASSTTRTTTVPTSSIPTATTSRLSATGRRSAGGDRADQRRPLGGLRCVDASGKIGIVVPEEGPRCTSLELRRAKPGTLAR